MKILIKKIINKLCFPNTYSSEAYIKYLRRNGASIGKSTRFVSPKNCRVDINRIDHISIGNNCCIVSSSLIAHDYSWYIFIEKYNMIIPDAGGPISIGNNVFVGADSMILKNVTIGDNVIIGAKSLVTHDIESNSVYAGNPAKKICDLDDFFRKKRYSIFAESKRRYNYLNEKLNAPIDITSSMGFFSFLFLDRTEENFEQYISKMPINGENNRVRLHELFFDSKPYFNGLNDYIKSVEESFE